MPVDLIYHYTDLAGLTGIVREGGLWLTDANYLNDRHEIQYGLEVARKTLAAAINDAAFSTIADHLRRALGRFDNPSRPRVCVASFCQDGDNLSQWRAYGSNGARVAIGFKPFEGRFRALRNCNLRRVVYEEPLHRHWLQMMFEFYRQGLQHDRALEHNRLSHVETHLDEIIYNAVYEIITSFKNSAYLDERESRFIYGENWPEEPKEIVSKLYGKAKTRYRVKGRLIVPYVAMSDLISEHASNTLLPLHEVIVGPQEDSDLIHRGVTEFLRDSGYGTVTVQQSKIPFRPQV